ncbi:MAG TPA: hypothetical protein VLV78_01320 [Thermoanaerobaculia bacterium]|nr:hypothetical protein [Thermoanaerobaculia bacterium]
MSFKFDKRAGRRLHLKRPAPALILGGRVGIVDVGLDSIGVEHDFPLTLGGRTFLEFSWSNRPMRLSCVVARTDPVKGKGDRYRSGLRIDPSKSPDFEEFNRRVREGLEQLKEAEAKMPPSI